MRGEILGKIREREGEINPQGTLVSTPRTTPPGANFSFCRPARYLTQGFGCFSSTPDPCFCMEAIQESLQNYGLLEIFNTDQGSQFLP